MSAEKLSRSLRRVQMLHRGLRTRHYQNKGDLHLLHIISHKYPDGTTPSTLAKELDIALPTVSQKLSQLEELDMIDRVRCAEDRRKTFVKVSQHGREVLDANFKEYIAEWEKICNILGEEKTETLAQLLDQLEKAIILETEESES